MRHFLQFACLAADVRIYGVNAIHIRIDLAAVSPESGCHGLFIGFESLSQETLERHHKVSNKAERYKEQVATYTEVLDAERQLALSLGDYYISLIQYRIARAVLERQMGIIR